MHIWEKLLKTIAIEIGSVFKKGPLRSEFSTFTLKDKKLS